MQIENCEHSSRHVIEVERKLYDSIEAPANERERSTKTIIN